MPQDLTMFYDEEGALKERPETKTKEELQTVVELGKPLSVLQMFAEMVELGVQWDWFESYLQWQNDYSDWIELRDNFIPSEDIPEFTLEAPVEPVRSLPSNHLEHYYVDIFKKGRQQLLDNAIVTISTGKSFDADELSIGRMSNAILAAISEPDDFIIKWSTADTGTGELVDCTLLELKEAHKLAMQNMASIWSIEG